MEDMQKASTSFKNRTASVRREAEKIVKAVFDAIPERNVQGVLPFYASDQEDFIFIHNNSEEIARDNKELAEAYEKILNVDAIELIFDEDSLNFPLMTDNTITVVGKHFLAIRKKDKTTMDQTHFTMTLKATPGGLKILHHHSAFPVTESSVITMESDQDLEPWPFYKKFGRDALHRRYKSMRDSTPTVDPLVN